ncbi:hypothetical protein DVH05_019974 [Phytophthora capsici]|nr:hypothetical protein DVH05_019974 [Phytophthora capsici]
MRSARSLETKWRQIRADVSKFIGNMATARAMPKSGESAEDVIERAEQIYTAMKEKEAAAVAAKKNGKGGKTVKAPKVGAMKFKLHHCWRILEKEPKWLTFRENNNAGKPSTTTNSSSGAHTGSTSGSINQRPQGNKAAKEEAKAQAAERERRKRVATAAVDMADSSRKRTKALLEANRIALFSIPLNQLDPDAQQFFRLSREAALREVETATQDNNHRPRANHTRRGREEEEEEVRASSQQTYSVSDMTQRTEPSQEVQVVEEQVV